MSVRNPYTSVQKKSVQSQFASLTSEKEKLKRLCQTAQRECAQVERQVQEAKQTKQWLQSQLQVAQETLGTVHHTIARLRQEHDRLAERSRHQRAELERLQVDAKARHTQACRQKNDFCKQMQVSNDEMESLADKLEDARLLQLLTVDSLQILLTSLQEEEASTTTTASNLLGLQEAMDRLAQAMNRRQVEQKRYEQLMQAMGRPLEQHCADSNQDEQQQDHHTAEMSIEGDQPMQYAQDGDGDDDTNAAPFLYDSTTASGHHADGQADTRIFESTA